LAQAKALASAIPLDDATPTVVLGDVNSYSRERPMRYLGQAGLKRGLGPRLSPRDRYTYVYHGRSGMLDAALMDDAAQALNWQGAIWHFAADEARQPADHGPWGASDHDALILDLLPR